MDATAPNLNGLFKAFSVAFNKGLKETTNHYTKVAMTVPSSGASNNYGWLKDLPGIREWIGDRIIHDLSLSHYVVENRLYEETVSVRRTQIEDDQYGVFSPIFEKMGSDTARHPDKMVFELLASGFSTKCFDGQYFFDADHEVGGESVSNVQTGDQPAWFLLDCSQSIKPMVWQERLPFSMARIDGENEQQVFFNDRYVYGVRGRSNAGYGLWQLAFGSKLALTPANYAAARAAMTGFRNDSGRPLGVTPTHLVVPPSLESAARRLLLSEFGVGGETNEWKGTAELIITPWVAL
ncbi:MAG: Mu-like prophage major head subunit gpT family protein [Rhizobiaceae bacterium]|nr:Mu-like prophage major head subunit gpT family protein [Rhizobiaceae bacterium]